MVFMAVIMLALSLSSCSSSKAATLDRATLPTSSGQIDSRPQSCPKITADSNSGSGPSNQLGIFPWPQSPSGISPPVWAQTAHTPKTNPPVRPSNWSVSGGNWKLTSARSANPKLAYNPQELCGVRGNSVDLAWQKTTGSPTTVIAVLDSGIEFCDPAVVNKIYLNESALPLPENAQGLTKPELIDRGVKFSDGNPYDLNNSGVFNIQQYSQDPRIPKTTFCSLHRGGGYSYTGISPADLIDVFGTKGSPYYIHKNSPTGFDDAIAGWNFVNDTNNPYDTVHYDHGTGEAEDSAGAAGTLTKEVGSCPNCMILPVRVGDSFMTSGNAFGEGVLFAVDSGASMIQEALGTYNTTKTDTQAIAYAVSHGVPIIASAADEESEHYNLPAALEHTIVVNSITHDSSYYPPSYLYLNGCTNYGGNIAVSVESASCSSEATGKASGIVGLAISAANLAVERGIIKPYPNLKSVNGSPVSLSVNEIKQLVTMSADDVNFQTAAAGFKGNNYSVKSNVPVAKTVRYPTTPGFDPYTGYGRINAAKIVNMIMSGKIPPQAEINDLSWFNTFSPNSSVTVNGLVGTPRGGSWRYELQVGVGVNPKQSEFYSVGSGSGTGIFTGKLGTIDLSKVAALFPKGTNFSTLTGTGYTNGPDKLAFTIRVVVQSSNNLVGMARRTEYLSNDPTMLAGFPIKVGSSIVAPIKFAPIGPHGTQVMLVADSSGSVMAIQQNGKELPGWPVYTGYDIGFHPDERAFKSRNVTALPHGEIMGGVAVGALESATGKSTENAKSGSLDVVVADLTGHIYAFNSKGKLLKGWPTETNRNYSLPSATNYNNRLLPGIFSAPVLANLTGGTGEDVVVSSMDRHVYAFEPDGAAVPGWPVLVVDPSQVQSVDPVTNKIIFKSTSNVLMGTKLMDSPAVAQILPNGPPEIVVGSNEQYREPSNANLGALNLLLAATGKSSSVANSRLYAIYPNGNDHTASPVSTSSNSQNGSISDPFLPGWPVKITDIEPSVLPDIGDGISNSPAVLSFNGNIDIAVSADAGPLYLINSQGGSQLGTTGGLYNVFMSYPPGENASDKSLLSASIPALGSPSFSIMNNSLVVADTALSAGKALDLAAPADQIPHESQLDVWSVTTGQFLPGFPVQMDDYQFFEQPVFTGIRSKNSYNTYVFSASAYGDLRGFNYDGKSPKSFPKFTGGWVTGSPSIGSFNSDADPNLIAVGNREGEIMVWNMDQKTCLVMGNAGQGRADLANTNSFKLGSTGSASFQNEQISCPGQ